MSSYCILKIYKDNAAQFPPSGLSTAPTRIVRRCLIKTRVQPNAKTHEGNTAFATYLLCISSLPGNL